LSGLLTAPSLQENTLEPGAGKANAESLTNDL